MALKIPRFVLLVGLAFLTRLVLLTTGFVDADEAVYLVGADVLRHGGRLYVDFADHKPPLIFLYFALGRLLSDHGMLGVRLLTVLAVLPLTAYATSAFYRHDRRGLLAAILFLVYGSAFLGHDMLAVNCEWLMLLPIAWSLVLVRDPAGDRSFVRLAVAGVLLGVGILFKYQAAAWGLPLLVACAWAPTQRNAVVRAVALAAGVALPLAVTGAIFVAHGTFADFVYWNLSHNVAYALHTPDAAAILTRAASYLLPFLLAVAPLVWAGVCSARDRYAYALLGSGTAAAFLAALVGGRLYPHYFIPLYLPLALAAAPAVASWWTAPMSGRGRTFAALTAALWIFFTASDVYLYGMRRDVYAETRPVFAEVAARLRQDACFTRGPLFVWGSMPTPIFYAETGLAPASRFVNVDETLTGCVSTGGAASDPRAVRADHWDLLMSDLARKPPAYVLDPSAARLSRCTSPIPQFPRLAGLVAAGYDRLDVVSGVTIYKRRGCEAR